MKHLLAKICLQGILLVLGMHIAYALPVGNPSEPNLFCNGSSLLTCWEDFNFRVGYYGDFDWNRHTRIRGGTLRFPPGAGLSNNGRTIRQTKIDTNAAYLVLNYCNFIDAFATLGQTKISIASSVISFDNGIIQSHETANVYIDYDDHFSWSVGLRAALIQWRNTYLGVEGQYFQSRPHIVSIKQDLSERNPNGVTTKYWELQFGAGIAQKIGCLIPYAGVKWSRARFTSGQPLILNIGQVSDTIQIFDYENDKSWGYAIGATLLVCNRAAITIEGRFVDEKALYVNGQLSF